MRLIGHIENEAQALRISSALLAEGIDNQVESDEDRAPAWAVWVLAEEDLERARRILAAFRANPEDPLFGPALGEPLEPPRASEAPRAGAGLSARGTGKRRSGSRGPRSEHPGLGEVTLIVTLACAVVGVLTRLTEHSSIVGQLQISETWFRYGAAWDRFLPEVRGGQVWRVFTPALLHFGWPHLLFNLWTFWDLGRAIEWRRGSWALVRLVFGLGVISNLGQYVAAGPNFGGLSGVIYGLLGYVWMLGRHRPEAGLALHPQMVLLMLVWFVICLSGALGVPVANMAHGVGLVAGMWWGRIAAVHGR